MIAYIGYKGAVLWKIEDYDLQNASVENYFSSNEKFTTDDGFQIAAGLTEYDGSSKVIEDPTFGTLKMYHKTWNVY